MTRISSPQKKILILLAHPNLERSKVNQPLVEGVRDFPGVIVRNLYALYPEFRIDVAAEQALLREVDAVVLQFPFYWYGTPALLKQWQDHVLTWQFAFGPEGTALKGKPLLVVVSAGSADALYKTDGPNEYSVIEFLRPLQKTFQYCGMVYEPPVVVHGASKLPAEELQSMIVHYRERLRDLGGV